jgi:Cu(I)/Ag(I) efflux system membrane protein CusA/SilA
LVIAVAFLPIFALVDQEGRLFKPLAYSKNLTMALAAILAVTLDPALRMMFARVEPFTFRPKWLSWLFTRALVGTYYAEEKHPISRTLFKVYEPVCRLVLRFPKLVVLGAVAIVAVSIPIYFKLGREFMPPLNEGTVLYMPTTLPGISVAAAEDLLQTQDRVLKSIPEVERVFGKAGRADTSTDPAPFSMMETTVVLKPQDQWRAKPRFYDSWPNGLKSVVRPLWPDRISWEELIDEMDRALRIPGVTNAWTMPIKARIDMLSTGVRTPIGIKIFGADTVEIERIGERIEGVLRNVPGTRSVYAERTAGGYFVDFEPKRDQLARFGLTIGQFQDVLISAIGGENVSTTIEGRQRYPINVRYPRELRDDIDRLRRVLVTTSMGYPITLEQVATIKLVQGPSMIRDENGFLVGYVYVDVAGRDVGSYVDEARAVVIGVQIRGRDVGRAVLGGRCDLALLRSRLQRLDCGLGRHDCFTRLGRRDRRLHAALSRFVLR